MFSRFFFRFPSIFQLAQVFANGWQFFFCVPVLFQMVHFSFSTIFPLHQQKKSQDLRENSTSLIVSTQAHSGTSWAPKIPRINSLSGVFIWSENCITRQTARAREKSLLTGRKWKFKSSAGIALLSFASEWQNLSKNAGCQHIHYICQLGSQCFQSTEENFFSPRGSTASGKSIVFFPAQICWVNAPPVGKLFLPTTFDFSNAAGPRGMFVFWWFTFYLNRGMEIE